MNELQQMMELQQVSELKQVREIRQGSELKQVCKLQQASPEGNSREPVSWSLEEFPFQEEIFKYT